MNAITETLVRVNRNSINRRKRMQSKKNLLGILSIISIVSYAIIAVISDIFANKLISVWGLTLTGGVILIPFSFTIRDLMHRMVGYNNSKRIVWVTAIINLLIAILLVVLNIIPAAIPEQGEAWNFIMGASWRVIIASFIGQLVADLADTYIFEVFTRKLGDKHTWLRVLASNIVSIPLDSGLFVGIAFLGVMPLSVVWATFLSTTLVKLIISTLATPLAYLGNFAKNNASIGEVN